MKRTRYLRLKIDCILVLRKEIEGVGEAGLHAFDHPLNALAVLYRAGAKGSPVLEIGKGARTSVSFAKAPR